MNVVKISLAADENFDVLFLMMPRSEWLPDYPNFPTKFSALKYVSHISIFMIAVRGLVSPFYLIDCDRKLLFS
jgi:hypothetical protein